MARTAGPRESDGAIEPAVSIGGSARQQEAAAAAAARTIHPGASHGHGAEDLVTRGAHDHAAERPGRSPYAWWPALAVAWHGVAFGDRRMGQVSVSCA